MKAALLLLLCCLADADDVRWEVTDMLQKFQSKLEGQHADMAARLSASETKIIDLQNQLQTHIAQLQISNDQLRISNAQLQTSNAQLETTNGDLQTTNFQLDCRRKKLCERDGFTYGDGGLCYYISTENKTWDQSRQWCRDRQSDLMVIKSQDKQDLVASFNQRIWLGLTDTKVEGSFQWVDGTPLTTPTYWRFENNPNPNAQQNCVEYYDGSDHGSSSSKSGWNDSKCSYRFFWICERVVRYCESEV